jgi:hypothetical protein
MHAALDFRRKKRLIPQQSYMQKEEIAASFLIYFLIIQNIEGCSFSKASLVCLTFTTIETSI